MEYSKELYWEHAFTRSDFADEAINICKSDQNLKNRMIDLVKQHQIVWITRDEEKKLDKSDGSKYRSKRNGDEWKKVYNKLNIKLEDF